MDRKSVISLIIFTIVWLKTIKFYRIWSVFGQLIQTSTKFCSCKIVLKHSSFKEKLLKIEVKKMNLGLLQWSGGDANHFFFYLALTRIIQARTQEDALGACAPPPPPPGKMFRSEMSKRGEKAPSRYVVKKEYARSAQIRQN